MSFGVRTPIRSRPRAPLPRQRDWRVGTELARASERSPCDFPWTTDEDAACRPLLSETTTSTHSSSISLRRPRMTCATHGVPGEPGVSRHRNPPEGIRGAVRRGISSSSVPLDRPPGAPVAIPIRSPDLREEESRCHSALAEDPRGDRRDRFRRRSVKTADFPDPGRLPSVSTLRGCSFVRVALPPAPDPSSFLSSFATHRDGVRPLATPLRGSPRGGASRDPTTLTDFCNTTDERTHREPLDSRYRECPRASSSPRISVKTCARRAGRRRHGIAPASPSGPGERERGRLARCATGDLLCSAPVHPLSRVPGWRARSKDPVPPGSA